MGDPNKGARRAHSGCLNCDASWLQKTAEGSEWFFRCPGMSDVRGQVLRVSKGRFVTVTGISRGLCVRGVGLVAVGDQDETEHGVPTVKSRRAVACRHEPWPLQRTVVWPRHHLCGRVPWNPEQVTQDTGPQTAAPSPAVWQGGPDPPPPCLQCTPTISWNDQIIWPRCTFFKKILSFASRLKFAACSEF